MSREQSKTRKWEKDRRDRINEAFNALSKVLPCYNPSITIVKIDILTKAATHIKELQEKVTTLVSPNPDKKAVENDCIKKLQDRVKKLLIRNEQLCNILRDANISIPSSCGTIKKFTPPQLWSNKINAAQAKVLHKKELEKKSNLPTPRKTPKKKIKINTTTIAPKHRKILTIKTDENKVKAPRKKKNTKVVNSNAKCVIVFSQASVTQPCYIITNTPANNVVPSTSTATVNSNSTILATPLITSTIKPFTTTVMTGTNPSISTLGPGTLILANGTILPVLPQTQNILPTAPTIISNNPNSSLIVVSNISTSHVSTITVSQAPFVNNGQQKKGISNLKPVKPKICLTRTTQVNKVPIPALTSRYANNYVMLNNVEKPNISKKVKIVKKVKVVKANSTQNNDKPNNIDEKVLLKRKNVEEEKVITNKKCKLSVEDSKENEKDIQSDNLNDQNTEKTTILRNNETNPICEQSKQNSTLEVPNGNIEIKLDTNKTGVELGKNIQSCGITNISGQNDSHINLPTINLNPNTKEVSASSDNKGKCVSSESPCIPEINDNTDNEMKTLENNMPHSELSNDIFASLQVPTGCQNPESTSPTAAFLLTFPLVSSLNGVKVAEVIDEENTESQTDTPNLLQIGTMVGTKTTSSQSDVLTPSLLNLDNFSFFTGKEFNSTFCNGFPLAGTTSCNTVVTSTITFTKTTNTNPKKIANNTQELNKLNNVSNNTAEKSKVSTVVNNNINILDNKIIPPTVPLNIQDMPLTQPSYNTKHSGQNLQKPVDNKIQYLPNQTKNYPNINIGNSFNLIPDQYSQSNHKATTICTYPNITKSYCNSVNSNMNTYSGYNYNTNTNMNQNYHKNDNRSYYPLPHYENYSENKKNDVFNTNYYSQPNKFNNNPPKVKPPTQSKPPINWMTTPDNRIQTTTDFLLPPFNKENEFGHNSMYPTSSFVGNTQTTYFNTNSMYSTSDICSNIDNRKTLDLPLPPPINNNFRAEIDEWSPTKMPQFLDPLVGDLGLSNNIFPDQKHDAKCGKDRSKETKRTKSQTYENQSNFLSVSQLVETNKSDAMPARTATRRNSGNRCKNNQQNKQKRKSQESKDTLPYNTKQDPNKQNQIKNVNNYGSQSQHMYCENKTKNSSTNYTAEALIGHTNHNMQNDLSKKQNYNNAPKTLPVPPFLSDNIIPYFPPVEFTQDNSFMQQNQNFNTNNFSHNFGTFQNNSYTTNTFMSSASTINSNTTYIPTNNFVPDSHEFTTENFNLFTNSNKEKQFAKSQLKQSNNSNKDDKTTLHGLNCPNSYKKQKKKPGNDTNFPGFDIQYLSLPGNRNSPLLPDDFHTHTSFLTPTTPYKMSNPLYHKQNPEITPSLLPLPPVHGSRNGNQTEISPSINNVGSSLTNFNLSTIFPEINKGPLPDLFRDAKNKDQVSSRNYNVTTSSLQVPFHNKSTFNFS